MRTVAQPQLNQARIVSYTPTRIERGQRKNASGILPQLSEGLHLLSHVGIVEFFLCQ